MTTIDDAPIAVGRSPHPLDPLTGDELGRVASTALAAIGSDGPVRLVEVELREPDKAELRAWSPGEEMRREARVVAFEARRGITHEMVVSLDGETVVSDRERADVQPAITIGELLECEQVVRADPDFQAALRLRGVTDPEKVTVEGWGIGNHAREDERGRRLVWAPCWLRENPDDNPYAHPIDGLFAIVDLAEMSVIRVEDHGVVPVPTASGQYRADGIGVPLRDDLRPLEISQREGPSFTVDGWEVKWQRWSFRVGFTPREGLVLHQVAYDDQGRRRSILHRASYGELAVPYGHPGPSGYRKAAFDIGEFGFGALTNSLTLGCDCLGEIHYFDVEQCDEHGRPYTIENAICLHEEDIGILWKHYDATAGDVEVRRSRRLVISFIITAGNYEYAFYWHFYQDGRIEAEVKATGIVITQGATDELDTSHGALVAPDVLAPHHQHFFCARLDFDIDGEKNTVHEVHSEPIPIGEENPHGNAFRIVREPFVEESDARRLVEPLSGRYWTVNNERVTNAMGEPVGYKLVPGQNVLPFAAEDSDAMQRGAFMRAHFWVTQYDPAERFPAGDFPNQHPGGDGLPTYQAANRKLKDEDVVVWYNFGSHHITRPEDWPVMPVDRLGFELKPVGFFDRNPALDVPPSNPHCQGGMPPSGDI